MKNTLSLILFCVSCFASSGFCQNLLEVEGNGLFTSPSSTNVDLKNTNSNTNASIRFGDNNLIKASAGFNGLHDVFQISMGSTLSTNNLTISESGNIGINSLPGNHRFQILHNSTAASAHLRLQESNTAGFARLRFENAGDDGLWTIAGKATEGSANLNFFHHDGTNFGNILSIDGDDFHVGIMTTAPEGYLHIKQQIEGVHALILENNTNGEKWAFQVGLDDLDVYLDNFHIGSFDAVTGAYSFFGAPSAMFAQPAPANGVLEKISKLKTSSYARNAGEKGMLSLNPQEVEKIDPTWVVRSEDGAKVGFSQHTLAIVAIQSIQEQQAIIQQQKEEIKKWESEEIELEKRLKTLEAQLKTAIELKKKN